MINNIYIFGGGSSGVNLIELIVECKISYKKLLIVDDYLYKKGEKNLLNIKIVKSSDIKVDKNNYGVCSIADTAKRKSINLEISKKLKLLTIVHPSAIISKSAKLSKGVVIFSGVRINHNSIVEKGSMINFNVDIGHDVKIGSNSTILTNSLILGNVIIGSCVLLGAGSKIFNNIKIGKNSKIAFGTNITRDVKANTIVKQKFDYLEIPNHFKS